MTYSPLFKEKKIYHGADYNPEQWLDTPEVLEKDIQMMKEAHCNIMSVGIFSWAKLEPEEGVYTFDWLKNVLDKLNDNGIKVFLATPSAARPAWLSKKYPEVLRVYEDRHRILHGVRHNHCPSSEIYRQKVAQIDEKLAKEFAHHPAVIGWHISNEFGGYCYCDKCQEKFRQWLKKKYVTLDALNKAWWTTFWAHTYTDWSQIEAPSKTYGEYFVHGMNLDWKRFNTENVTDFYKKEVETVKKFNKDLPATTNFMEFFYDYDYFEFAKALDFISWDSYPEWHVYQDPEKIATYTAMNHDLMRSYKGGQPFVLMESCPSATNWRTISKLKKPGMHTLASLQALAHGADNIQYFQWRKSRGSSEKFHGAVIDHVGTLDTRVGREVKSLGEILNKLSGVVGAETKAQVAIVFDTVNRWAVDDAQGPRNIGVKYLETVLDYYKQFYRRGIAVDVIDETCDLSKYKLVVAPMTYMIRGDYGKKVEEFVNNGGTYVSSFWSGIVDDTDLCFLGGFPGPLKNVLGIWDEEIESLVDEGDNANADVGYDGTEDIVSIDDSLKGKYKATTLCGLIHPTTAKTLAVYDSDFFKGMSAITVNDFGKGKAYYMAAKFEDALLDKFVEKVTSDLSIHRALVEPVFGVSATERYTDDTCYLFIGNYKDSSSIVKLDKEYVNAITGEKVNDFIQLDARGSVVLKRNI